MKTILLVFALNSVFCFGQLNIVNKKTSPSIENLIKSINNLTLEAAFELTNRANQYAQSLDKKVSIAILDVSGSIILLSRGDGVGPHNTEAARKKAFTALSTKTSTLILSENAANNSATKNLNTLPELLLLGGGRPIWYNGNVIGSIGIAGGGSPENDDLIAKSASIPELGIITLK